MSILFKGSRALAQPLRAGVRQMSHATEAEAKEQMARWTQISKGMMALTGAFVVLNVVTHGHEHHEEAPKYAYLKMRTKPFPWHYSDCDLLDSHCKELARAAERALAEE
ncbi:TPA: hypothetical protein N0F65_006959 [Lagenidium giganteum]|uniref:Mitochondrial cytochrome c oxidase subunit VIa n=1 Tax=Lagenidium giganteum TaxID=4803 RepID=A0AAV2ZE66_9STRA|nr:TPA: hypothetical protein N0F65_006959 [Lagenidium giganteum]